MNEIKINLDNLTTEERDQLMALVKKGNKSKDKVWKPAIMDAYWFVSATGRVYCNREVVDMYDDADKRYEMGNCFPTAEDAEEEATRRKMLTRWKRLSIEAGEGKNPWNNENKHYFAYYDVCIDELEWCSVVHALDANTFFPTEISLRAAIAELGEENVKRYILGVDNDTT